MGQKVSTMLKTGRRRSTVSSDAAPGGGSDAATLLIDTGTGEMKLIAALNVNSVVSFHELAIFKGDTMTSARELQQGDASLLDALIGEFSKGLDKLRLEETFTGVPDLLWPESHLGATAWYRTAEAAGENVIAQTFLEQVRIKFDDACTARALSTKLSVDVITGEDEALYEQVAVEYAVTNSFDSDGKALEPPLATISGGSGSMQITGFNATVSFPTPLKKGTALVEEGKLSEWVSSVASSYAASEELRALQDVPKGIKAEGERLRVVCISGNYYAAMAAGLVHKGDPPKYISAMIVVEMLQALIGHPSTAAKDAANAARLVQVIESLFGEEKDIAEMLFARDWTLNGAPFRTTWTAGWWLKALSKAS